MGFVSFKFTFRKFGLSFQVSYLVATEAQLENDPRIAWPTGTRVAAYICSTSDSGNDEILRGICMGVVTSVPLEGPDNVYINFDDIDGVEVVPLSYVVCTEAEWKRMVETMVHRIGQVRTKQTWWKGKMCTRSIRSSSHSINRRACVGRFQWLFNPVHT